MRGSWDRKHLVVSLGGGAGERGERRLREPCFRLISADARGVGGARLREDEPVRQRGELRAEPRAERAKSRRDGRGDGGDQLRLTVAAGADDAVGGALGALRDQRERIAEGE